MDKSGPLLNSSLAMPRNDPPARRVGNREWREFASSPAEALARGVFRGSHAFFDAMDAEKERQRQAWFQEHAKRPA